MWSFDRPVNPRWPLGLAALLITGGIGLILQYWLTRKPGAQTAENSIILSVGMEDSEAVSKFADPGSRGQ